MNPKMLRSLIVDPVLAQLGVYDRRLSDPRAARLLVAIAMQESNCCERRQRGNGPARGLLQFETGGVAGALVDGHPACRQLATELGYISSSADFLTKRDQQAVKLMLEQNDILAFILGRALLWTDRKPLPDTEDESWASYIATWRPGKPRREKWAGCWAASA